MAQKEKKNYKPFNFAIHIDYSTYIVDQYFQSEYLFVYVCVNAAFTLTQKSSTKQHQNIGPFFSLRGY